MIALWTHLQVPQIPLESWTLATVPSPRTGYFVNRRSSEATSFFCGSPRTIHGEAKWPRTSTFTPGLQPALSQEEILYSCTKKSPTSWANLARGKAPHSLHAWCDSIATYYHSKRDSIPPCQNNPPPAKIRKNRLTGWNTCREQQFPPVLPTLLAQWRKGWNRCQDPCDLGLAGILHPITFT